MKKITLHFAAGLLIILCLPFSLTINAQIQIEGLHTNHEGSIGWNADGTGPEPAATGHQVPFPGFAHQYFYGTSCDYDDVDPDPNASLAHFIDILDEFPAFESALTEQGIDIEWINIKTTLGSLGDDIEGFDWMVIGDYHYTNYYGDFMNIYMQDQLLVSIPWSYVNFQVHKSPDSAYWHVQSGFTQPFDASENSNETAQYLAAAFMQDMEDESLQITYDNSSSASFSSNGRTGRFFNIENGYLKKGSPELPFTGLYADHEGFAGWDADGTGPEPEANGHSTVQYYGASLDYDNLDDDENAALGHFVNGGKGFVNLLLQLEYRGYSLNDLQLTFDLMSLGPDVQGEDWGSNWWNYYNQVSRIMIGGEVILESMSDTVEVQSGWSSKCTYSPVKNVSLSASDNAKFVANAFLMDFGDHQIASVAEDISYSGITLNSNGRNGGFYEVNEAKIVGKCSIVSCIEPGYISGTLTQDESPYLINGHLSVPNGETLTIEPGAKLAFRGPYHITIEGSVEAMGTADEPIIFTHSNPLLTWDGFDADAVAIENDSSKFDHCIFEYGYGYGSGPYSSGGIFAIRNYDKLTVKNSTFRYNVAEVETTYYPGGGAVALWDCSPLFMNCIFHDNYAGYFGGAVLAYHNSDPIFSNCLFFDNYTDEDGGAIAYYEYSNGLLINCTFANNYAVGTGGAMDCYDNSNPKLINTIFWGNRADGPGQQISTALSSNPGFYYCDVQGGEEGIGGNTYNGDYENCIDENPLFIGMWDHPYQINEGSPCIDKGNTDTLSYLQPENDLAGYLRIENGIIDIGAYEWNEAVFTDEYVPENSEMIVYPNPFNEYVYITFELEQTELVEIEILNLLGQKTIPISQQQMSKGLHTINWNTRNLTNGFYFIRLQTGNTVTTKKALKQ
jgi:hypothetical protein